MVVKNRVKTKKKMGGLSEGLVERKEKEGKMGKSGKRSVKKG